MKVYELIEIYKEEKKILQRRNWKIYWLFLTASQPFWGYFMPRG